MEREKGDKQCEWGHEYQGEDDLNKASSSWDFYYGVKEHEAAVNVSVTN